jgi:TP901 family phage tail tape measure protein
MSAKFVIPSVFTAVDKFTGPVKKMSQGVSSFASKAETGLARAERGFRKLTPTLSSATKQFMSFAAQAAIGGAIIGGIGFSVKSLIDYETALASTQAITGTSNKEFEAFKKQIEDVAKVTKKSTIEVAKGFEIVGSQAPELLKNSKALGEVTNAAITLSKASGDDLATSAQNLTGVMNQFSLTGGASAARTMNVLAAGSVVGSANITQVGESMKNFGSVASSANLSLEESVALVEVLGKFSVFGAEAGTKLRGSVLQLQKAGMGYTSGQFNMNDALAETKKKFDSLKTAKEQDAMLNTLFGAENVSTGKILMKNTALFAEYTKGVTGTSMATDAANVKSNTLSNRLDELKNGWINMITGSGGASKGLETVKKAIEFVTNNLDVIVSVASKFLIAFVAIKTVLLIARGALMAYNVVVKAITIAQWLWNAAMNANPIGLIIAGVVALTAVVYGLSKAFSSASTSERLNNEVKQRALDATIDQRVELTMLFASLRQAKVGSEEYKSTLEKLEQIQPGIIQQYNLQAGALKNINQAEKDLTASIMKRAEAEARAEMIKEKIKESMQLKESGGTGVLGFAGSINDALGMGGLGNKAIGNIQSQIALGEANVLAKQQAKIDGGGDKKKVNPQKASNESISKNITEKKESLTIDFKNMPQGVETSSSGGKNFSTPSLGTTN